MEEVLGEIRKKIHPGKSSLDKVQIVVNQINKALEDLEINADCVVGGSFAKDTHLKGDHDVDLFVRFDPKEFKNQDISKILYAALPFKAEKLNGSRNYFQFDGYGMVFEVVPVLRIKDYEEAQNVTDMSPLHVVYLKKITKKKPQLTDEIRLAKAFCKANKVYGAESYIQGFSGHVLDLLVTYYGSFEKLLRAASNWGQRLVIDIQSHWANPLKALNKSKLVSPLVLVDPIQPDRNAAAALSDEKYELFKAKAKEFLENPSADFFKPRTFTLKELQEKSKGQKLIMFNVWPYKSKQDVMGAKLRKVHEYVFAKVQEQQWPIIESDWEFHPEKKSRKKDPENEPHGMFYFIINPHVKGYIERRGPPLDQVEDVRRFTKVNKNTYLRSGRVFARVDRKHNNPTALMKDVTSHKYVKERSKKVDFIEV